MPSENNKNLEVFLYLTRQIFALAKFREIDREDVLSSEKSSKASEAELCV